jgi:predicted  nucleic acid-binding Zn-ribbon protein
VSAVPPKIPDNVREEVVRRLILNESYQQISSELGISHGTVTNIQEQWKFDIGTANAQAILDLVHALKELGITPAECAEGAQIVTMLNEMGARATTAKGFLSALTDEVAVKAIMPGTVASTLLQVKELSRNFNVPLPQVPEALENAHKELERTETLIASRTSDLEEAEAQLQSILDELHTTREDTAMIMGLQRRLKELGLSLERIDEDVVNVIHSTAELGNDPIRIAGALASVDSIEEKKAALEAEIQSRQETITKLEEKEVAISTQLTSLGELQTFLNELIILGFNQTMLKELLGVVKEVSESRSIPFHAAAGAFLAEVKSDYEAVVGFKAALKTLKGRAEAVGSQLSQKETALVEYADGINSWMFLKGKGVQEQDVLYWQRVFRDHPALSREMLAASLREYADLTEAIASMEETRKGLEFTLDSLKKDGEALQKEKIRAIEEMEQTKKTAVEEQRNHIEKMIQMLKREQELIVKVATDVLQEKLKEALLEGVSLGAASSPLLKIILWEKRAGPLPRVEELIAAGVYVLYMLQKVIDPSDPLINDLANAETALNKRLNGHAKSTGSGNSSNNNSTSSNGGTATHIESGAGGTDETKK